VTATAALPTVLVIDDEPQIRRVLRNALQGIAGLVVEADTGEAGVDQAAARQPDVIVLDLGLPDRDGVQVCRDLRGFTSAPILVLSARHTERDKIDLLDAGADDFVTKPFGTGEFQARVRAQLRRASRRETGEAGRIVARDLVIDLASRTVTRAGEPVHLTPTEWGLLRTFVTHAGKTLTHRQLFAAVWGNAFGDAQQYLRVYVAQLRRKIEADSVRPRFIKTEPSVGYRFELED